MTPERIGRYRILRTLGSGGMGTVYEALDEEMNRPVAIKGLHGPADPGRLERLRREALTLATLEHPAVTRVHEIIAQDGCEWVVMERVPGRSLADILGRGPLPVDEVLRIGEEVASALAEAHRAGVVHRDVKAENVMVTPEGAVKVLDFGLAHRVTPGEPADDRLTSEGMVVGTSKSMSPEQARGRDVDARSDVFSLGSLLYEMATGQQAFSGGSPMETMLKVARAEYEPPARVAPDLPPALCAIIERCLALDPDDRYPAADDVARDLRAAAPGSGLTVEIARTGAATLVARTARRRAPLVAASAVIGLAALAAAVWFGWLAPPPPRVVAVLPVEASVPGQAGRLASAAVADTLSSQLSRYRGIAVIAASTVRTALRNIENPDDLARAMAADEFVRATLSPTERAGEARLEVERIDGRTGTTTWSADTLVETGDLLLVQDRIATMLGEAYRRHGEAAAAMDDGGVDPEAYRLYLQAYEHAESGDASDRYGEEISLLERALHRDADFVPALIRLSTLYDGLWQWYRDEHARERSEELLARAARIAPDNPEILEHLANRAYRRGEADRALDLAQAITRSNPGDYRGWWQLGRAHLLQLDPTAAEAAFTRAVALYPGWQSWWYLADARIKKGDYSGARDAAHELLERRPDSTYGQSKLAEADVYAGRFDEAQALYEKLVETRGGRLDLIHLGNACFYQGDWDRAEALYRRALELDPDDPLAHANLGDVFMMAGRKDEARAAYARALELARDATEDRRAALETTARCLAWLGHPTEAVKTIDHALETYGNNPATLYFAAAVHAINGDRAPALVWAERALDAHAPVLFFTAGPEFAGMRDDPEFVALLDRYRDSGQR